MKYLLLFTLFFSSWQLTAQEFRLQAAAGVAGLAANQSATGPSTSLQFTYAQRLPFGTYLLGGLGWQYQHYKDRTIDGLPWDCPGDCAFTLIETESYTFRRQALTAHLGLEQHLGKVDLRLTGQLAYRIRERFTGAFTTLLDNFSGGQQPTTTEEFTVKPQEAFGEAPNLRQLAYTNQLDFSLGLSGFYPLGQRLKAGLGYQLMITPYDLRYLTKTVNSQGNDFELRRIDARTGTAFLLLQYTL
ncbi:MAG: hypothetical protein AAF840_09170 [Bacteroidota bacterium]